MDEKKRNLTFKAKIRMRKIRALRKIREELKINKKINIIYNNYNNLEKNNDSSASEKLELPETSILQHINEVTGENTSKESRNKDKYNIDDSNNDDGDEDDGNDEVTGEDTRSKNKDECDIYDSDDEDNNDGNDNDNDGNNDDVDGDNDCDVLSEFSPKEWNTTPPEIKQLREWAIKCRIPQAHLDHLLKILQVRLLPSLPLSSKTFLETCKASYSIEHMEDGDGSSGEFAYIGIKQGLLVNINTSIHKTKIIELQINCDGLSLSKSSSRHIWPILCKIYSNLLLVHYEPFVVGLYVGTTKPKNADDYLSKFVTEMNELLQSGIDIGDKHFSIQIKCFICDTPARAFLKGTQGHAGFHACERCNVVGTKVDRTTTFPMEEGVERTNASFRNFSDPHHHKIPSPLLFITPHINMISAFILDFMHLGFLGAMAKLLNYWFMNDSRTRQSQTAKTEISKRLEQLRSQIPSDFQRKIRTLSGFSKYKATELKFLALYSAPIILKGILNKQMYHHFLLFHVSSRLLWSKKMDQDSVQIVKEYLKTFCSLFVSIYGPQSATLNTHNLIHVADDVTNMRCSLSEMTAFPFESMLGKIKRYLRSPHHTIAQLCRRLHEELLISQRANLISEIEIKRKSCSEIKKLQYKGSLLSSKAPDNIVLLKDNTIVEIKTIHHGEQFIMIEGKIWNVKSSIYNYPVSSNLLHMWELHSHVSNNVIITSLNEIQNKMMKLSLNFSVHSEIRIFAISLLHE